MSAPAEPHLPRALAWYAEHGVNPPPPPARANPHNPPGHPDLEGPCRLSPHTNAEGYGIRRTRAALKAYGTRRLHRQIWLMAYGRIADGLEIRHRCDALYPPGDHTYRACFRLSHLELGTSADNGRDMAERGRGAGRYTGATHCPNGHEFTPENTYTRPDGAGRQCRACNAARERRYRKRQQRG